MTEQRTYGLITARGGSREVPRKNVRLVGGKPLIAWSIEAALASRVLDRVLVSTENEEIAGVAQEWGAETPFMRPAELSEDDSPHADVLVHALRWLERHDPNGLPDRLMLLQPTSPLRSAADIAEAVDLAQTQDAESVIGVTPARSHPYWTRRIDENGRLGEFGAWPPMSGYQRRQVLPPAYEINGAIYLMDCAAFLETGKYLTECSLGFVMPPERSLDIDTEFDLEIADLLLSCRSRDPGTPTP